ncbi:MAG: hypothetical protein FIA97_14500, partial [Methylococcaceae bacterium]|nr:hypothetical protein [Methylococcaceae bacterium]
MATPVRCIALILLLLVTPSMAKPLAPADVPEPLKPWIGWALKGSENLACPFLYENAESRRCAWPTRLELNVEPHRGSFRMTWQVQQESRVLLPGDPDTWPQGVELDGKPAVVGARDDKPELLLTPGVHTVAGRFEWDELPESLAVPRDSGLISLTVNGQTLPQPVFNEQGQLWIEGALQARGERAEIANRLDLQVFRRIAAQTPLQLTTWLRLDVSGQQREILLQGALLPDFIPMALESPLPARVEPDGKLRLQIRPGHWELQVTARHPAELDRLALPEGLPEPWPEQEIWSFEAHNELRVVEIEGVPAIDPQQTNLPDEWKSLPAYRIGPGESLLLRVLRKGDPEPEPDALNLRRTLWLDFAGTGYTVNDRIDGRMTHDWRLDMAPSTELGRVALDGEAQPITRLAEGGPAGVEMRRGLVNLAADSRVESALYRLPAVGWQQDFQSVSARLNLPPGWRLLAATGVDNAPETWIGSWTLLDLFMVLIGSLAVGRLWDWPRGLLALVTLTLLWQEPDAPQGLWLNLLAAVALLRVLPDNRFARLMRIYRNLALAALVLVALPFVVEQVRLGLYPQLEQPWPSLSYSAEEAPPVPMPAAAPPAAPMEMQRQEEPDEKLRDLMLSAPLSERKYKRSLGAGADQTTRLHDIDPTAITQTGPGLPRWNWNSVSLGWNGPVLRDQQLGLWLIPPAGNLILNLLRVGLLMALAWVVMGGRRGPGGGGAARQPAPPNAPTPPANPITAFVGWVKRAIPTAIHSRKTFAARFNPSNHAHRTPWWVTTRTEAVSRAGGRSSCASNPPYIAVLTAALLTLAAPPTAADYPPDTLLQELKNRLLELPECLPRCAVIPQLRLHLRPTELQQQLEVDAAQPIAIPLPAQEGQWLPAKVTVDGSPAEALPRNEDGQMWLALKPGRHDVVLAGPLPAREQLQIPLPLQPRRVSVEGGGWSVQGIGDNGVPDAQLQLSRELKAGEASGATLEARPLPPFVEVARTLQIGLDWRVRTVVTRISPDDTPAVAEVPLLEGESVTSDGVTARNGKVLVNLPAGTETLEWDSVLEQRGQLHLQAPATTAWTEVWRVDASPIRHLGFSGLAPVHHQDSGGNWLPEWRPWPGESIDLTLTTPQGAAGATLTIDHSELRVSPGLRATDTNLDLTLRSTQGGQHPLILPEGAVLQSVTIDGRSQPIRQQGRNLSLPIRPGEQTLSLAWREDGGIGLRFGIQPVDLGSASVNASSSITLGSDRWVLLAGGPRLGPAVLFWGVLAVMVALAIGLGRLSLTPLKAWQWSLLLIGLSQLSAFGGAVVVGWLLALGWRAGLPGKLADRWFNVLQIGLGLLTLAALGLLFAAVEHGLLGLPDMQVAGNNS